MIIDIHLFVKFRVLGFTLAEFQWAATATHKPGGVNVVEKEFNPHPSKKPWVNRFGVKLWVY